MKKSFDMSARTAMQIWRGNFSSAEWAIIELVKNSYDADSHLSYIYFFVPLGGNIFDELSEIEFWKAFEEAKICNINLSEYYKKADWVYFLDENNRILLENKVKELSYIYILDNWDWMTEEIIIKHWMIIATDNKKKAMTSSRLWRIRTWEKWIWRFALDRLWSLWEMITCNFELIDKTTLWSVDWSEFEKEGRLLSEIEANITTSEKPFDENVKNIFTEVTSKIKSYDFWSWTLLKISNLRDLWNYEKFSNLENSLDNLIPPSWIEKFDIIINWNLFDEITLNKLSHDNFDYKLICKFTWEKFNFSISRNEFDISKINFKFLKDKIPYNEDNFSEYEFSENIWVFLPNKDVNEVKKIGPFDFEIYFSKKQLPWKKDIDKFFYRSFLSSDRKKWLKRFSWIKIFRDNFRVRPYWEIWTSWDWLWLWDRAVKDPSAPSRAKKWRVNPDNISWQLKISRKINLELLDKSNREWIIENKYYFLLVDLLLSIIKKFEDDRSTLLSLFSTKYTKENPIEDAIKKTEYNIKKREEEQKTEEEKKKERKNWSKEKYEEEYQKKEEEAKKAQDSYEYEKEEKEKEIDEKKLLNTLATKWVVFNSLQHEIKENKNEVNSWLAFLNKFITNNLDESSYELEKDFKNPFTITNVIKKHFWRLSDWVEISLTSTRKDRRFRKNIILSEYFEKFSSNWLVFFEKRGINFSFTPKDSNIFLKSYELDLDTIFQNLIINSWEAFDKKHTWERKINIDFYEEEWNLFILYKDNWPWIDKERVKNIYDIFEPDFTTKKDGTWLWMWLLKITMESFEYSSFRLLEWKWFWIKLQFKK